ncbi:HAD-IIB family hydrolase [Acidaminobacter sp. JC074]|uniref:HAD-IIB family hydrolase n=1 Tax=Acidaminobacter sp. JC074 TaxID=2530199 RepID=UPI001F0ECAB4|nr:HAD-IIB family hydrolase [Acidaminobacter sp. JC074]
MRTLYVSDLDGTLLDKDGKLSDQDKAKLNELIDSGTHFTVASARSVESIRMILDGLKLTLPIISFNGAFLSDFASGKHIKIYPIMNDSIFDILKEEGALVSLHKEGQAYLYHMGNLSEGAKVFVKDRENSHGIEIDLLKDLPLNYDVMSYTVIGDKTHILNLEKRLSVYDDIIVDAWEDMYYKPYYWLSVHSSEATKARGIDHLRDYVHVDRIVVFGDNTNDIEMFKYADIGIAVENAVDELKELADQVIGSHDQTSVINKIIEMEKS